jgi:hypothetical protein
MVATRTEALDYALDALLGIGRPDRLTVGIVDSEDAWHGRCPLAEATLNALIIADPTPCKTALAAGGRGMSGDWTRVPGESSAGGLHSWHDSATMSPTTRRSRVPRKSSMEAALSVRSDARRYLGPLGFLAN